MKSHTLISVLIAILVSACMPAIPPMPTAVQISTSPLVLSPTVQSPTQISTLLPSISQPQFPTPAYQVFTSPTPGPKLERWSEYENALAKALVPVPYNRLDKVLCEWVILGQSAGKVYVWAVCQQDYANGEGSAAPAVITLAKNGQIEKVEIPRDGPLYAVDVRSMFPPELVQKIFTMDFSTQAESDHLQWRLTHPGPPLMAGAVS